MDIALLSQTSQMAVQVPSLGLYFNRLQNPLVIAAHPQDPNRFAVGLSDGAVYVFEPLESDGKWGVAPPVENGSTSSLPATTAGASVSDQAQR